MEAQANPQIVLPSSTTVVTTTIIKKYKNRKLYNTDSSRYVTLRDIYQMFTEGKSVQVINNVTEEDVTVDILLQALAEQSKGQSSKELALSLITMANYLSK